jgi:hypothetical protein
MFLLVLALVLAVPGTVRAGDVAVPIGLQAELLFAVAGHDRNLSARSGGVVRTLILTKGTDDSARCAAQFKAAAVARSAVAGLPHSVEVASFTTASALAQACHARRLAIIYLTPGFTGAEVAAIGQALEGCNVLTVTASPAMVRRGAVLGFDLVSGRAKLLVDPIQAAKQRVAFGADVLGLMTVPR